MPYLNDPVAEIIDLYAYEARQNRIAQAAASVDPPTADRISSYARNVPWMPAGVSLSLARAGVDPDDERVNTLAKLTYATQRGVLGMQVAQARSEAGIMGGDIKMPAQQPGGIAAVLAGQQLGQKSQQLQGSKLQEIGWQPIDRLAQANATLQAAVNANSIVIKDGVAQMPRNSLTRKGRAFERLQDAFAKAGVPLPFIQSDERWGENTGRMGVQAPDGSLTYLDEALAPAAQAQLGSGQYQGVGQVSSPLNRFRSTDGAVAQGLREAGVPIDPNDPFAALAPITRPAAMTMDAPMQELQGQFRNVIAATHGKPVNWTESQSDLGIALKSALDGRPMSTGSGFFVDPESEVARERRRRESKRGLIGGHNITIGRFLADQVTEPDTKPFLLLSGVVDAGVQLADWRLLGLNKLSEIREARALFEAEDAFHTEAGLVNGIRRAIHGPTASTWLQSKKGVAAIDALTSEESAFRIWVAMDRKIDPAVAEALASTRSSDETSDLLQSLLGPQIRTKTEVQAATKNLATDFSENVLTQNFNQLRPRVSQSRLLRWMPQGQADTFNPRQFATQIERHMVNAKVPIELQEEVFNQIARDSSWNNLVDAAHKAMGHEQGILVQHGVGADRAKEITSLARGSYQNQLEALTDEIAFDQPVYTQLQLDGMMTDIPSPHIMAEQLERYIPLPDAREIRRLTANPATKFLTTSQGAASFGQNRFPIAAMDFVTQEIWKTGTLLGRFPAWVTRVVGESQLRMATAGLDSMFNHPLAYFGWALGRKGGLTATGLNMEDIEEFRNSLSSGHGGWIQRPGSVGAARPWPIPNKPEFETQFRNAWAGELAELHTDPITRHLLDHGIEKTESWLKTDTEGKKWLNMLQGQRPGDMQSSRQIQEYLHTVSRRIEEKTGGDTDLIDAIRTGSLGDTPIISNGNQLSRGFRKRLRNYQAVAPDVVKGYRPLGNKFYDRWTKATDAMFAMTMGFADNLWDRAPTFRQYYWQHMAELLPYGDATARARIIANAERSNLPDRMIKGLYRANKRGLRQADTLEAEALDFLARGYAADSAKKLLYDLNEKGQLADAARIIAPFGNAYQEIFGAWGKLLNDIGGPGPSGKILGGLKLLHRTDQILGAARGEDFGKFMGAPQNLDGSQNGFFMQDEHGQEVFVIPGSQWATQAISGVPVPLTGNVQGLNMVGNVVPGLGPVAAIPTAWMIQNKPQFQGMKDLLLPYGAPGERQPSDITQLLTYAPPWMRRAFDAATNGGYDQRTWANAQKDVMTYLYSTGKYDTTTREGLNKLTHDAKRKARDLYYIRSFAQTFSPTTPSFRFLTEDKSGRLLATAALTEEFYNLQRTDYDNAAQLFMQQYGENAILATIPKSGSTTYGIPRTREQADFVLNHPDIKKNFPSTYGFFLPQEGEFDYDVYLDSFQTGERETMNASQWANLANSVRGDYLYNRYKEQVGDRTDPVARDYLRRVRQRISEMYPSGPTGLSEKPDTDQLVQELYKTLDDPTAMSTDAGQGLKMYLGYRDQAMDYISQIPGRTSFARSKDTEPVRVWLNDVAQRIIDRHPEFQFVWDIVLSRETDVSENASRETDTASREGR